jgi:radical SAM protein with 4Fe4S-binding SPASM domain
MDIASRDAIPRNGAFVPQSRKNYSALSRQLRTLLVEACRSSSAEEAEILGRVLKELEPGGAGISRAVNEQSETGSILSNQELDWMEKHAPSQWLPYVLYRYRFKIYPPQRKLLDFPLHLLIEPTSICNLRCVMCFQVDTTFTKREYMGMMPWELFTSVVDQAREHRCNAITLASRGEPTLHRRFGEMLQYIADAGVMDIKINTNATKLTEKLTHEILAAGVNQVVFSVDAATKATYESIRVLGKFEQVVENIDRFNTIRAVHYPQSPTVTRISGVLVRDDQDVEQMSEFWSSRVDQIVINRAIPRWDSYNNPLVDSTDACGLLWERMYVWYDGTVNPCDFDYKSCLAIGNASEAPLSQLWTSEPYRRLREAHLQAQRTSCYPCDRCPL